MPRKDASRSVSSLRGEKTIEVELNDADTGEGIIKHGHITNSHGRRSSLVSNGSPEPINQKHSRLFYQTRRAIFIFGALLGLLLTLYFGTSKSNTNLSLELDRLVSFDSVSSFIDDWKEVLPQPIQLMLLDAEKQQDEDEFHGSAKLFLVGRRLAALNYTAEFNVLLVPGTVLTGIELWGLTGPENLEEDCPLEPYFRKRLWGSYFMLKTMILDKTCWLKHIMLDPISGLDPPGVKLRAAQGFEATDFFMAGYWIWNKVLQNLAVIGYGPDNMYSAAYDWRLAYLDLEKRDSYFSKLKTNIELLKKNSNKKTILVGHLMGLQIIFYFMKWVEAEGPHYGNGGKSWCNDYLEAVIDIAGSSLGTPKAITALLSGEMRDTIQLNSLAIYGLEKFFSRRERLDMLRTFGGIASMFPKGGKAIWGTRESAPDDNINVDPELDVIDDTEISRNIPSSEDTFGTFLKFKDTTVDVKASSVEGSDSLTIDESIELILEQLPDWFSNRIREQYLYGIAKTKEELEANDNNHSKWLNPLEATLPNAPDMKIYCFYGVGKPTERAYVYTKAEEGSNLNYTIDIDAENPVVSSDGDGTVLLLTHSMCHEWQKPGSRFNPANIEVTIVEIKHEPDRFDIRGGPKTADHVDILGSAELNELILTVALGKGDTIENRFLSALRDMVQKMQL